MVTNVKTMEKLGLEYCRGYLFFRRIGIFCENGTIVPELCRNVISVVHLAVIL